jgi:predicted porin
LQANTQNNNTGYQAGVTYRMIKLTNLYAAYGYKKSENKSSTATVEGREAALGIMRTF